MFFSKIKIYPNIKCKIGCKIEESYKVKAFNNIIYGGLCMTIAIGYRHAFYFPLS